jgi:hypothetical protein
VAAGRGRAASVAGRENESIVRDSLDFDETGMLKTALRDVIQKNFLHAESTVHARFSTAFLVANR